MFLSLPITPRPVTGAISRLFLAAGLALGLSACVQETATGPAVSVRQTTPALPAQGGVDLSRPVMVALLAPLSSADSGAAATGTALANAARMALTDLSDPALQLRVYDTNGTPEGARAAAQAAVGEGAALILGPLFGANTPGVGQVAGAAGVNVISFSTDSAVAGGPVFLSGFLPEAEAERVVGFAAARGMGRIGVFYPRSAYGEAARRGAETAAYRSGGRVVVASAYDRTFEGIQDGAEPFAGAAEAAGVTAVLLPEGGKGLQTVGAFMDYHGLDPSVVKYMGLGQWNAGATLMEPTLRGGWFPAPDPARVDTFSGLYEARYGARPPFIAVLGYDAVQVAGQLLAEARRTGDPRPFGRAALTRPDGFQGALGPLRFGPDGLSQRAMAILEVGAGGFEIADPAPGWLGSGS